jgi:hypothetical protein
MSPRKPRKATTASDAQRIVRDGVRRILTERADEWRPLWLRRDAAGAWRVEPKYGGAPELTIDVQALPAKARPVVQALIELLDEQAWCARLAGVLAQADLASATGRELTRKVIASNRKAEAAARGEALAGRLLVAPVKIGGALSTCELIDEAGRKAALAGGAKRGGYWASALPARESDGDGLCMLIGEGAATMLSAIEATGDAGAPVGGPGRVEPGCSRKVWAWRGRGRLYRVQGAVCFRRFCRLEAAPAARGGAASRARTRPRAAGGRRSHGDLAARAHGLQCAHHPSVEFVKHAAAALGRDGNVAGGAYGDRARIAPPA